MSVNKVIILGNCGNDPEIRQSQNGEYIANFSIATSENWKDKSTGEKKEKTEWHKVVAFGALAVIVKNYVKKGAKLYIEGQLQTRRWTDKDGIEKYITEIVLKGFNSNLQLLDSKGKLEKPIDTHNEAKGNGYQPEQEPIDDDSIPF